MSGEVDFGVSYSGPDWVYLEMLTNLGNSRTLISALSLFSFVFISLSLSLSLSVFMCIDRGFKT